MASAFYRNLTAATMQKVQAALNVDFTIMMAGSEAYCNAQIIYNNIKFLV